MHQRTDKVKIARTAKVEEIMEALNPEEAAKAAKRVEKEAAAIEKRKEIEKRKGQYTSKYVYIAKRSCIFYANNLIIAKHQIL